MAKILKLSLLTLFLAIGIWSCSSEFTPKPKSYFRIDFPERNYQRFDSLCPYVFEFPTYSSIEEPKNTDYCWKNIYLKNFNARIYLSYKNISISDSLHKFIEDSHTLAYKHSIKADAISEQIFINEDKKAYGILYVIKGNAATPLQFHITDSTKNFLRGSLYFNNVPNKDSLAPVIDFLKTDIIHLMETLEWK